MLVLHTIRLIASLGISITDMSDLTSNSLTVGSPSISSANAAEKVEGKLPYIIQSFCSFDDMSLSEKLLRGIYAYGFEKPSIIQQRVRKLLPRLYHEQWCPPLFAETQTIVDTTIGSYYPSSY